MKKFFSLILVLCFTMSITTVAFAKESCEPTEREIFATDENTKVLYEDSEKALVEYTIQPREDNYGNVWLDSATSSSFPVYTTYSGTLGFTFKIEANDNDSFAYISVEKPGDAGYFWNNVYVDSEVQKVAYNANSGTYTIHYMAYTSAGMRLMCWIYKR